MLWYPYISINKMLKPNPLNFNMLSFNFGVLFSFQNYLTGLISFLIIMFSGNLIFAEDKVYLRTENGTGQYAVKCEVISWTGANLNVRLLPHGINKSFNTSDVIRLETPRTVEYVNALKLMEQLKFKEALPELKQSLLQESRIWFKQEIFAQLVICYKNLEETESAIDMFQNLIKLDKQTRHLKLIPLPLFKTVEKGIPVSSAKSLMEQENNHYLQLLGASYLLDHPEHSNIAAKKIDQISYIGDPELSFLAKTQLWRKNMDDNTPAGILELWEGILDFAPVELQTAGGIVLGDAYAKVGRVDQAVELWLRPWSENNPDKVLVKQTLNRSIKLLNETGRKQTALRLQKLLP